MCQIATPAVQLSCTYSSGVFANVTFSFFRQWIINCVGRCVMQPRMSVMVSALIIEIVEIIEIICQS